MSDGITYIAVNGSLALLTVLFGIFIGIRFLLAYKTYKRIELFIMGFVSILLTEVWWAPSISFFYFMFTGQSLPDAAYFTIGYAFIPIVIFLWLIVFTNLIMKNRQKIILLIFTIYSLIYEIIIVFFLLTDTSQIGKVLTPVDSSLTVLFSLYSFVWILIALITGIIFSRESMQSSDPNIRLKGRLLLYGFVIWSMVAIIDGLVSNIIALFVVRFFLMLSVILLYGGFMLPDWMKKLINKFRGLFKLDPVRE